MRNNIPAPNPAVRAMLLSDEMRDLMLHKAGQAQLLYRSIVARRTGHLASSAQVDAVIGGRRNDRWTGVLTVGATYAASHEYGTDNGNEDIRAGAHDLNIVLNQLGAL